MAEKKAKNALAVVDGFKIASMYDGMDAETLAEIKDQMDDLDSDSTAICRKIKIPSGGGLAYEVQGMEDGDVEYMKTIEAVVVFTHKINGFWEGSYGGENKFPICASIDGKTGAVYESGEIVDCATCPNNQFGSGIGADGQRTRGKACKNMRRLYLMMDGDPNIYLLTAPPTSVKDVNKQLTAILSGGVPYTGLVLRFALEKASNAAGISYSKMTIAKAGLLSPAAAELAREARKRIKEQFAAAAVTADDYDLKEPGGFKEAGDDELPFN